MNERGIINAGIVSFLRNNYPYVFFLQKEHNPPHIHAIYGDDMAAITIADGTVLEGALPNKALDLVREWISLNKEELFTIWEAQEFKQLSPLE